MTDHNLDLDAIRRRADRALDEVGDICAGNRRWTMRIPAEPDRDSDLVISAALADVDALLAEVERLKANQQPDGGEWTEQRGIVASGRFWPVPNSAQAATPTHIRRVWFGPAEPPSDVLATADPDSATQTTA